MALVNNDCIEKSDAVICLEGDGYARVNQTIKIFQLGLAKQLVISGGFKGETDFTIPASQLLKKFIGQIPKEKIIIEEKSQNTYEQGIEVIKIAKQKKWEKIIIVASHFHQARAYLTFLKAMQKAGLKIKIFNSPARDLPWFRKTALGISRLELLEEEFKKIKAYAKNNHIASLDYAISYQAWKEQ